MAFRKIPNTPFNRFCFVSGDSLEILMKNVKVLMLFLPISIREEIMQLIHPIVAEIQGWIQQHEFLLPLIVAGDSLETLMKNVKLTMLFLPFSLREESMRLIQLIVAEIQSWIHQHGWLLPLIVVKSVFDKLCWTSQGTVDYRKTAENLTKAYLEYLITTLLEEGFGNVVNYLLSRLRQQFPVFKEEPYRTLVCLLEWQWPYLFLKAAGHVWTFLSLHECRRLLWLFSEINNSSAIYYGKKLSAFFLLSPCLFRNVSVCKKRRMEELESEESILPRKKPKVNPK